MNTITIDKGLEFEGRDIWYTAEVTYDVSFTPARCWPVDEACPASDLFEVIYASVDDVTECTEDGEISLNVLTMGVMLMSAIEEDAGQEAEKEALNT